MIKNLLLSFCFLLLSQSISFSQVSCCCGGKNDLIFPGFDFEIDPLPPPGGTITYYAGPMGPWTVVQNCVDIVSPLQVNIGFGNPNGPSDLLDLNNSTSPCGPGAVEYPLTGLVAGNDYTIEWWYCKAQANSTIKANCKIANGAWLDVTWTATTLGYIIWLKASYVFTAQASSAILRFSDAGSSSAWQSGMLMDDIKIYGCTNDDKINPIINNPPADITVSCIEDVPKVPKLDYSDNCDTSPVLKFKEIIQNIYPCRIITRNWTLTDACGNSTTCSQNIVVNDQEPPVFKNPPQDITVGCDNDIPTVPTLIATDNCVLNQSVKFNELKEIINPCTKKITRSWSITDACGNTTKHTQIIDIIDQVPVINNPPESIEIECDKDIPKVPTLDVSDNCSKKPTVAFTETIDIIDNCTKRIHRDWLVTDACGNTNLVNQIIDVGDHTPPEFTDPPEDEVVFCNTDVLTAFNDWIKRHGDAIATDKCGAVTWRVDYDHLPVNSCDSVIVEFIAADYCKNESSKYAKFIVKDTIAPKFTVKAASRNFVCVPNPRDSLRNWLSNFGFSKANSKCSSITMSSNFAGDSTINPLQVIFYAEDNCGNIDSCKASFSYRSNNDTLRIKNTSCKYLQNSIDTLSYIIGGCDSIVIIEKIPKLQDSIYISEFTCNPQAKRFDTISLVNSAGCDSLVFHEYILKPTPILFLQKSDCSFSNYKKDTATYKGQYCDSMVITEYFPLRKDSTKLVFITCDATKTDTTIKFLINMLGCDSIVTIYTQYSAQKMTFINKNECGAAKSFKDTVTITSGLCDSLVITLHQALALDTTHLKSSTCDKMKAGTFSNVLINQKGCDSLVINEVLLNPSDSIFISKSTCTQSQSGISTQALKNAFGCDSIVQTTTRFIPSDTFLIQENTCIFSNAGQDTMTFQGKICDSVIIRTRIFVSSDTTKVTQHNCDPASAGFKMQLLKGSQCDSVVVTTTLFIPSDTIHIMQTSCNPKNSGFRKMVLQNAKGCDSLLLINTNFVPLDLKIELDSITCFNQYDGIIKILNSSDFTRPLELLLNNDNLGNQDQINNLGPGFYNIMVRDQKGCITDSVKFVLINPEALIIDLGNDLEVKKGSNIKLNLQSNRTLQKIFWQPVTLTNCSDCNQINFTVNQDMWIYAQAIDERNCTQTDSILIRVKIADSVYAPNTFSPNGDNINDYFYIEGDDKAIVEIMFIFDRWGNKLFETHNIPVNVPISGWNGTFNAQKMNPGVYIFYAKVRTGDQQVIELKGDLSLIR